MRQVYADLLQRWGLLLQCVELLKHAPTGQTLRLEASLAPGAAEGDG